MPKVRGFGLKAKAKAVLQSDFRVPLDELKESLLDQCTKAGGNQYDVALQYIIVRARSIGRTNQHDEIVMLNDLLVAEQVSVYASNPPAMRRRISEARTIRDALHGEAVTE